MENLFYEKKRKRKDGEGMVYTYRGGCESEKRNKHDRFECTTENL
jgi:hypothetical protein